MFFPALAFLIKKNGSFYDMMEDDIQKVVDAAKYHDYILLQV